MILRIVVVMVIIKVAIIMKIVTIRQHELKANC